MKEVSPVAMVTESVAIELVSGEFPDLQELKYNRIETAVEMKRIFFFMMQNGSASKVKLKL